MRRSSSIGVHAVRAHFSAVAPQIAALLHARRNELSGTVSSPSESVRTAQLTKLAGRSSGRRIVPGCSQRPADRRRTASTDRPPLVADFLGDQERPAIGRQRGARAGGVCARDGRRYETTAARRANDLRQAAASRRMVPRVRAYRLIPRRAEPTWRLPRVTSSIAEASASGSLRRRWGWYRPAPGSAHDPCHLRIRWRLQRRIAVDCSSLPSSSRLPAQLHASGRGVPRSEARHERKRGDAGQICGDQSKSDQSLPHLCYLE